MRQVATTLGALGVLLLTSCADESPDGAESLEGETIELIVPYTAGGGYDTYARQLAPALGDELGATVTVVNEPGAGGLLAWNNLYTQEGDGLTIAIFNGVGALGSQIAEAGGVQYDAGEFSHIGRLAQEPNIVTTRAENDLQSFEDVIAADSEGDTLRFGASGPGSLEYIDAVLIQQVLDLSTDVIGGFDGSSEVELALLSGDVELHSRELTSQLPVIESGEAEALMVIGEGEVEELADVPHIEELATDDEQVSLIESHFDLLNSGRFISGPPDIDPEILEVLRDAFETVVTDEEYIEQSEESGRTVNFASGEELSQIVDSALESPDEYVETLQDAFSE